MSFKWWEIALMMFAVPVIYLYKRKTIMKFILIVLICLGLYFHSEVHDFFTPKPATPPVAEATMTIGDSLSISVSGPAVQEAASAVKGVVDSVKVVKPAPEPEPKKDEPNWLTKWLQEHTPKK